VNNADHNAGNGAGAPGRRASATPTLVALAMLLVFAGIGLWRGMSPGSTISVCVVLTAAAARVTSRRRARRLRAVPPASVASSGNVPGSGASGDNLPGLGASRGNRRPPVPATSRFPDERPLGESR